MQNDNHREENADLFEEKLSFHHFEEWIYKVHNLWRAYRCRGSAKHVKKRLGQP